MLEFIRYPEVFHSTTPFALTVFRTQLIDAEDMPNVVKVQAGYKARPLSTFLKQPVPSAATKIDFLPATTKGIKGNFYAYLDAILEFVPKTQGTKESSFASGNRHYNKSSGTKNRPDCNTDWQIKPFY